MHIKNMRVGGVMPPPKMMELGAPNISPYTHTQRCDGVGVGG